MDGHSVLLLAFVAAALTGLSPYHLNQITLVAAYCIALIGLNVVVGLAGQISLAHGAFFAIGAYSTAVLVVKCGLSFPLALFGAGLASLAVGFVTGLPALRLRGHYLAIATLALSVAVPAIANRWTGLTGGSSGLEMGTIPVPAWLPIGHDAYLFVWAIGLAALAIWAYNRVAASPLGIALLAVRENEIAAVAMGTNLAAIKVSAFAVSALLAGVSGGIFAQSIGFVAPENFASRFVADVFRRPGYRRRRLGVWLDRRRALSPVHSRLCRRDQSLPRGRHAWRRHNPLYAFDAAGAVPVTASCCKLGSNLGRHYAQSTRTDRAINKIGR